LSTNGILGAAGVLYAAALAVIILVPSFPAALAYAFVESWPSELSTPPIRIKGVGTGGVDDFRGILRS
jgi:hypothetical protein